MEFGLNSRAEKLGASKCRPFYVAVTRQWRTQDFPLYPFDTPLLAVRVDCLTSQPHTLPLFTR